MAGPAHDFDAIIVGGSLAGCAAAMFLGRAGARVALVEKQPDPQAFKRICSHFIQPSAVATLERLDLLGPIETAGGVRSRLNIWSPWGWIRPPRDGRVPAAVNLRRERLDPLLRRAAADTPGVEPMLGRTVYALRRDGDRVTGVAMRDRHGEETELRAKLVIGADGRDSRIAELAQAPVKVVPHERFAYGAYFEGADIPTAPDATVWMMDPQWAAAFPTDEGLTFYAAMPTKAYLSEFKRDPGRTLVQFLANVPEPPPIREGRMVGPTMGKLDMTNRQREPTLPGLALIGDAALATDPLWGVGCGWALQSAEWLADAVAAPLVEGRPVEEGLAAYRRQWKRSLDPHAFLIHDYASGRRFNPMERTIFSAATRDDEVAAAFEEIGTRSVDPKRAFPPALARAAAVNLRHKLRGRPRATAPAAPAEAAA